MTKHAEVANSARSCSRRFPASPTSPSQIGDPAVRNRGTIGGSIANNDPAADYPAACLALGATIVTNKRKIAGRRSSSPACSTRRWRRARSCRGVASRSRRSAAYAKFRNPASRYALVGVFVAKRGSDVRVAVTGAGANGVFRGHEPRGSPEEALRAEVARRHDAAGRRPQRRHPRQPGISRPSHRRHGQAGGDGGHRRSKASGK